MGAPGEGTAREFELTGSRFASEEISSSRTCQSSTTLTPKVTHRKQFSKMKSPRWREVERRTENSRLASLRPHGAKSRYILNLSLDGRILRLDRFCGRNLQDHRGASLDEGGVNELESHFRDDGIDELSFGSVLVLEVLGNARKGELACGYKKPRKWVNATMELGVIQDEDQVLTFGGLAAV